MVKDVQIGCRRRRPRRGLPDRRRLPDARDDHQPRHRAPSSAVPGVTAVQVVARRDERRAARRAAQDRARHRRRRAGDPVRPARSLTRVYARRLRQGRRRQVQRHGQPGRGAGRSGLSVGVVDADIYGHSVPRMLGVEDKPTQVDNMIMPPQAYGVKVISIGMFTPGNTPVVWRGPMLHRALQQFLADVWWGDLDVLLHGPAARHRRRRDLGGPAGAERRDPRGDDAAARRRRGGRAGRRDRHADPPAGGRRRREHVLAGPARRRAHGGLRLRRRRGGLRRADQDARRPGAAARPDPAGHPAARGRRRRCPDRAGRAGLARPRRRCERSPTARARARAACPACPWGSRPSST